MDMHMTCTCSCVHALCTARARHTYITRIASPSGARLRGRSAREQRLRLLRGTRRAAHGARSRPAYSSLIPARTYTKPDTHPDPGPYLILTLTLTLTPTTAPDPGPDQVRTVDANERVLPSAHVDWAFKAEKIFDAATGTAPWVPTAAGTSNGGGGGDLRKAASAKQGEVTSAGLVRWKAKADGKAALREAGVFSANPSQLSP